VGVHDIDGTPGAEMHFSQFRMIEQSEVVNQICMCVWIVIGELWKQRNNKILKNERIDHTEILRWRS